MSIDIDWHRLTTGPEGAELAASIRDFIHEKFQQVELPRFIRSVQVHSFDFGEECPSVEIKDFGDPWPEFYEDESASSEDTDEEEDAGEVEQQANVREAVGKHQENREAGSSKRRTKRPSEASLDGASARPRSRASKPPIFDSHAFAPQNRTANPFSPYSENPFRPGSTTPGIPGGTSNFSYFHLPLSSGLRSGTQTPLAAAFGPSSLDHQPRPAAPVPAQKRWEEKERTAILDDDDEDDGNNNERQDERANDLQTTLYTTYSGNLSLSLTAEILLDYPMPSFVGIPLALKITGLSFDGVGLLVYMRPRKRREGSRRGSVDSEESKGRCHFCFLGPEDARVVVGEEESLGGSKDKETALGGLLREIRVETEIGRQENGKQVLKNVGKVEKFVLEQVRRIFEEEFVWPSFWTFLV